MRIAALMTCHNRRASTLACLESLGRQNSPPGLQWQVYLVDDGCTDGTAEAVARRFPEVRLLHSGRSLYWCGGMRLAFAEAMRGDFDYYLWLNDDTTLDAEATTKLLAVFNGTPGSGPRIAVGTTRDADSSELTYGGVVRGALWHPFRFRLLPPADRPLPCDTMNGNCVLVPREVAAKVGNLDAAFQHGFGDFDYGLRARKAGCGVWVAPGTVGVCARNRRRLPWRDAGLSRRQRWAAVTGAKGLPPREMLTFARRHGGPLWPLFWSMPYFRALLMPTRARRKPPLTPPVEAQRA